MRGVVTLRIKQYGEYRLPVLKGRPEFLHKIYTFLTPGNKQRVATLSIKLHREYQLSAINESRESIKNRKYFFNFGDKFEEPSDTQEEAWEEPIPEKSEAKISLDCPFKVGKTGGMMA
jgi:hypothetical protein